MREVIEKFGSPKVLVIGDAMIDVYIQGRTEDCEERHIGEKFKCEEPDIRLGGAANVAANLKAMGAQVTLCCSIGISTEDCDRFKGLMTKAHIDHWSLIYQKFTTTKFRYVKDGKLIFRSDQDCILTTDKIKAIKEVIGRAVEQSKPEAIVLCDYAKGMITKEIVQSIVCGCGIPVFCDPSIKKESVDYRGVNYLFPNRKCFNEFKKQVEPTIDELVVKLDRDGAEHRSKAGGYRSIKPFIQPKEVVDTCGAGDVFLAAFVMCRVGNGGCQRSKDFALDVAVYASGLSCKKLGTNVVSKKELLDNLKSLSCHAWEESAKYYRELEQQCPTIGVLSKWVPDLNTVKQKLAVLRNAGKKIVFVNGCFDVLHPGHYHLLREAKKYGDFLIVALNGDETVRRQKGPGKPYFPLRERARAIEAIPEVDCVTWFSNDHPGCIIKALRPNVIVKGDEYKNKPLPELQDLPIVKEYLPTRYLYNFHPFSDRYVEVVFVESLKGFSSSQIIDRIQRNGKTEENLLLVGE